MRNVKTLLAMALALAVLALPSAAEANHSQTSSRHELGTLTVQVEVKGPHELGWSSLGFKLASCKVVSHFGCSYSLVAVEVSLSAEDCPQVLPEERLLQFHRAYFGHGYSQSLESGAHSFKSFQIGGGKAMLCWYINSPGPTGYRQNVARTIFTAPS